MAPEAPPKKPAVQSRYAGGYTWSDKYRRPSLVQPHEPLELYIDGGFHPVGVGDTFHDDRYTVRHKLGYGGFSTVWLARDNREERWVALKIKKADVSTSSVNEDPEIKAFAILERGYTSGDSSSPRCFAQLLDTFQHYGPNGTHICIVTELLGPTLSFLIRSYNNMDVPENFRPDTILRASRQLLEAIDTIHRYGVVHADIAPGNVAFNCLLNHENDEILEALGGDPLVSEYIGPQPRPANLPRHLFPLAWWQNWYDSPDEDIRLLDWGESFPIGETRSQIAQPPDLRSPETIFVGSLDYRHDLWRVGCLIHFLLYQTGPWGFPTHKEEEIQQRVQVLGPLPPAWHEQWLQMNQEKPPLKRIPDGMLRPLRPLSQSFEPRRQEIISKTEKNEGIEKVDCMKDDYQALRCLLGVMEGLMQHEPDRRITAEEALARIVWVDHWRDGESEESGYLGDSQESEQESEREDEQDGAELENSSN